jgi:cytidylate kinase
MAKFKVTFKEDYMPHEVTQYCDVRDEEEVKRIYGLDEKDIEWYEITKED